MLRWLAFTWGLYHEPRAWHNPRVNTQIAVVNRDHEMRRLYGVSVSAEDRDEREAAKARMRELAASYRGFPGQRRRGELPAGVEAR